MGSIVPVMGTDAGSGAVVARRLRALRSDKRVSVRQLSALLGDLGHPLLASGVTKIEKGQRRVSVDDLVALALALEVKPIELLIDPDAAEVALTPTTKVSVPWARAWFGEQVVEHRVVPEVARTIGGWTSSMNRFPRRLPPARRSRMSSPPWFPTEPNKEESK
jgi:transcriptional regulator with XRE-family HTH domain